MTDRMVHLGFEVGSGDLVEIPILNLAVTGQTQRSGKTTTLEALVQRSGVRALTFVTKRGEGSFVDGRRIQPYFRDRADWQFVTSILDATLQEKNKFLRPWIIRICRTTKTLRDVQRAVREELKDARGINQGVYTQLDAYLELIVPEIERTPLAKTLDLRAGLNVMDVSSSPLPMQMLFVQSAIDWVNECERDTVVVIPEAWEMVPEGKSTPVKASAESLVRKGSGIGNHIWLDSQDMAGVSKILLRGCAVWLIGVQRESNEIKRNLSNIPASIKKPTPAAVATLEKGQFYACWGSHAVKTYVQPAWMEGSDAQYVARGKQNIADVMARTLTSRKETTVTEQEAQQLRDENRDLQRKVDDLTAQLRGLARSNEETQRVLDREAPAAKPSPAVSRPAADIELPHPPLSGDSEAIYQFVKQRLATDAPALLRVVTIKPELEVQVQRKTLTIDGTSLKGRLARMLANGFLREVKRYTDLRNELQRTGPAVHGGNLSRAMEDLVSDGFVSSEADGYKEVPDMKVRIVEA